MATKTRQTAAQFINELNTRIAPWHRIEYDDVGEDVISFICGGMLMLAIIDGDRFRVAAVGCDPDHPWATRINALLDGCIRDDAGNLTIKDQQKRGMLW